MGVSGGASVLHVWCVCSEWMRNTRNCIEQLPAAHGSNLLQWHDCIPNLSSDTATGIYF